MTDLSATYRGLSTNARGALWMVASAAAYTLATTLVKYLGGDYGASLQAFYRQAAALVVLLPIILRNPRAALATTRPGILLFRAAAGTTGIIFAFYSVANMPLAEANALSFTRALWIVPLAWFVLREAIGWVRIAATVVGFGGVLLMLQPGGTAPIGLPALAALASALLFAMTVTGMKVMTRDHSATVLVVWSSLLGFVFALPPALFEWRWPSFGDLALLCTMGVLSLLTQTFYIRGMALGDAAAMAPIDYTRLVFALAIGFAFFGEIPNAITMLGAAIVIASTLLITIREARQRSAAAPPV